MRQLHTGVSRDDHAPSSLGDVLDFDQLRDVLVIRHATDWHGSRHVTFTFEGRKPGAVEDQALVKVTVEVAQPFGADPLDLANRRPG
ncbi:hypothetical protein BH790_gp71 [Gordonia phage Gsput1]|uniref:Uncharacterized protein n=1 Tax=Gordonia phage Gsput1 TaxID=1622193 RepID=A0A0E3T6B0_9CAUD|nr:hypothetical protein BH790_gp71 [Gordonia phage Gsput1]AKC03096.1 hypothetical protein Gsput1_71 [Gordonia phage Gsput1]